MKTAIILLLLLLAGLTAALAGRTSLSQSEPDWHCLHPDSVRGLPTNRLFYLEQKAGLHRAHSDRPEAAGLRLVGKWGGGPSWMVTGRDTLAYLSRGSEVVVVSISDPNRPRPLAFIQSDRLTGRAVLQDSLLYVTTSGGIEVYDVTDPARSRRIIRHETAIADLRVEDTLVYTISADSFKVYSFADPENPRLLGACQDSGYVLGVSDGIACIGDRWGLYVIDARDPANPRRTASLSSYVISATSRGTLCYVTTGNPNVPGELNFSILNVADPANPVRIGYLPNVGAYDCYLADTLAFLSGYYTTGGHEFRVLNIADSTRPSVVGTCSTPGNNVGVWANPARSVALVADWWWGLGVVDISNPALPVLDTAVLAASEAGDIGVSGDWAYVADYSNGLIVLDLTDPTAPVEVARLDTNSYAHPYMEALAVGDSVAYVRWMPHPYLRTVDISDPRNPRHLGGCPEHEGGPKAIVLRDTLGYTAGRYRFQVVNVADPRNPVRVGVAVLPGTVSRSVGLGDMMAYVANGTQGLHCISLADLTRPEIVGSWSGRVSGVAVADTVVYVAAPYTGCVSLSVADPVAPRVLDSLGLPGWYNSMIALDTLLYVGGSELVVINAATPGQLRVVGSWTPPYLIERLAHAGQYLLAACSQGGVSILEATQTGVGERGDRVNQPRQGLGLRPNPTRDEVEVTLWGVKVRSVRLFDVSGRRVLPDVRVGPGVEAISLRLTALRAGVYFVEAESEEARTVAKLLKH